MKPVRSLRSVLAWFLWTLGFLSLSACNGLPGLPWIAPMTAATATPTFSPQKIATPTLLPADHSTAAPPQEITIWLPPEFNPASGTPSAKLLRDRLDAFGKANGVTVTVRLKADTGPGGLLESLNAASAAAPLSLPGVIALSRPDLETAALKGLIISLDGASQSINSPDWYDYARQLALVQGAPFGLPFAGDAVLTVYRPSRLNAPPSHWDALLRLGQPLAFAAGSQQALTTLMLYQANDGLIEDAQRRPVLQPDRLGEVLSLYRQAADRGIFPTWLSQVDSDDQVWQMYQEGRVNAAVTWSTYFLSNLPADSTALAVPSPSGKVASLATGWALAVSDPLPDRRALSFKLAEWLVDPEFLAGWTEAARVLPTRPSVLAGWKDQSLRALLNPIALSARARPSNDLLASLGPVLHEAAVKVIRLESDPQPAAAAAAAHLSSAPSSP